MPVKTIIQHYYLVDQEGVMVDWKCGQKAEGGQIYIRGLLTRGRISLTDYEGCAATEVKEITYEGEVVTKGGQYLLGTISPDYQEYLEALKQGIPVAYNWNLFGNKDRAYYITADLLQSQKAIGPAKVVSQDGNFLTVRRLTPDSKWGEPEKIFVCWNAWSKHTRQQAQTLGRVADVARWTWKDFGGMLCKLPLA